MPGLNLTPFDISVFDSPQPADYVAPDFESAIATALRNSAALAEFINGNAYPIVIPEAITGDAVTYQIKEKPRVWTLDGPAGIAEAQVFFNGRSATYQDCRQIQQIIRLMFTPIVAVTPLNLFGIKVIECILKNESHEYVDPPEDSDEDLGSFVCSVDFLFRYRE